MDTLLGKAKKLNITNQNCMKTEQELKKDIRDTIINYKEIIFIVDSPIYKECLDELRKQQAIDEIVYSKSSWSMQ